MLQYITSILVIHNKYSVYYLHTNPTYISHTQTISCSNRHEQHNNIALDLVKLNGFHQYLMSLVSLVLLLL